MAQKEENKKKLEETTEQVKKTVTETAENVKEKVDKHPKLKKWLKRIAWALIGGALAVIAPTLAGKLKPTSGGVSEVTVGEVTEG